MKYSVSACSEDDDDAEDAAEVDAELLIVDVDLCVERSESVSELEFDALHACFTATSSSLHGGGAVSAAATSYGARHSGHFFSGRLNSHTQHSALSLSSVL